MKGKKKPKTFALFYGVSYDLNTFPFSNNEKEKKPKTFALFNGDFSVRNFDAFFLCFENTSFLFSLSNKKKKETKNFLQNHTQNNETHHFL